VTAGPAMPDKHEHNVNMAAAYDSYNLYRKLMDAKNEMFDGVKEIVSEAGKEDIMRQIVVEVEDVAENTDLKQVEGMDMIKNGIKVVLETVIHGIINGFLPTVERVRREADGAKRSYLDGVVSVVGAVMGKQECSNMIACSTGKWVKDKMPAAQLAVMMVESMVPSAMMDWFNVVKKSVIDRSDSCNVDYQCNLGT